jgi:hypothetical protein
MIDLERENPVTLAAAPQLIPAINAVPGMDARKRLHPRTIYNWASRGKRGVVLETVPVGGVLVTTKEAIQRFFARLSAAREQQFIDREPKPCLRTARRRDREVRAVREKLAAEHGI